MITLKLKIPAPSSMLVVNLLGALGLLGMAFAIAGITHNGWWGLLVGCVEAVAVSVIGAVNIADDAEPATAVVDERQQTVRPRAV